MSVSPAAPPAATSAPNTIFIERVSDVLVELWPLTGPNADVVDDVCGFIQSFLDRVGESFADVAQVACRKGCAWCCSVRVTATAPEIFHLARHIRADAPALVDLLTTEDVHTRGLDGTQRVAAQRWCALLGPDRTCGVYAARPASCRAVLAPDSEVCREGFEGLRSDFHYFVRPMDMQGWLSTAVMVALTGRGLAADKYELNHALAIAFADPAAEGRWLAGDDPLAPACATGSEERRAIALMTPVVQALGGLQAGNSRITSNA